MKKLVLTYLLFSGLKVFACDCIVYSDPKTYLPKVDLVFTGKVVELIKVETEEIEVPDFFDTIPGGQEKYRALYKNQELFYAKVIMTDNLKEDSIRTDTLFFMSEFTNCDPTYELNQSYLFFADRTENDRYMMVHCTPWGTMKETERTIKKIKK